MITLTKAQLHYLIKHEKDICIATMDYSIKNVDGINVVIDKNQKVISTHQKQEIELKEAIKKMAHIRFYQNFLIVNGKTYNGWNRELLDNLVMQHYKIKPREISIDDFEFED